MRPERTPPATRFRGGSGTGEGRDSLRRPTIRESLEGPGQLWSDLSQELAQIYVAITHAARGNRKGAERLMQKAGERPTAYAATGDTTYALTWMPSRPAHGGTPESLSNPGRFTPSGPPDLRMSRSQRASRDLKPGPRCRNGVRGGSGPGDARRPCHPCRRSCTAREHVARRPRRGHRYGLRGCRRACAWIATLNAGSWRQWVRLGLPPRSCPRPAPYTRRYWLCR